MPLIVHPPPSRFLMKFQARLSLPSPYSLSRQRTLSPGGKTSSPPAAGAAPWPAFASEKPGRVGRAGAAGAASPPGPVLVPSAALQQTTFLLTTAQDRLQAASKASSEVGSAALRWSTLCQVFRGAGLPVGHAHSGPTSG